MERRRHIKRAAVKLYLKYIFFLVLILASGLYYVGGIKRESVEAVVKNDMLKKSQTLRNTLKFDIINSLRWISIYENVGIFERLSHLHGNRAEIRDHEEFIRQLGVRNRNIDSVFLMDTTGKILKKYYKREGKGKRDYTISEEKLENLRDLERGTLYVDKISFGQSEASYNFYLPIYREDVVSYILGTTYNIDQFFTYFKEEFKDVFDTESLGILSSKDHEKGASYFSMDSGEIDIAEATGARYRVKVPFNLIEEMSHELRSYFRLIAKSDVFDGEGVLYAHVDEERVRGMVLEESRNYIVFTVILFIATSLLLRLYIQEKVEKIGKYKEIQTYNLKLKKTLEMKDMLFSIIGHDLRSPFTSLLGYFHLLEKRYDRYDKDQIKEVLDMMSLSCSKLSTLTENILRWSVIHNKKMRYKPEDIDLNEMVREYEGIFRGQLDVKQLRLKVDISEEIRVISDKNLLEGSLRNLISNAIKFSRTGGTISIMAEDRGNRILLSVEDNGVGIPEEIKPKLLKESYITTVGTGNEKGMGLGLYIAKELSRLNKGDLFFESNQGEGTRFTIMIPKT